MMAARERQQQSRGGQNLQVVVRKHVEEDVGAWKRDGQSATRWKR
jgi:hypothetical protein